jgi:hypothetical protein
MKTYKLARLSLYLVLVIAMAYAGLQLGSPKTAYGATCCTYGEDCPTKGATHCCNPGITEADCSQAKPNYCRLSACGG